MHRPYATNFSLLDKAQQSCLRLYGQFANLIEKQRAPISGFNQPHTTCIGTREGAFFVAKQLGLDKRIGDCCTVDRNHDLIGSQTTLVYAARHQLLTRPCFT